MNTHQTGDTIATKIENRLAAKGMTRAALVRGSGIPKSTFERHMANGGSTFTIRQVFAIASALGVQPPAIMPAELIEAVAA
ncbi:helix-turn-helix transcriptional regulator [Corynebacterium sp.]|uniref:helix-turn-helix domain-containing protein n=1 Tax=Corynebacterium sp. TaxID=1720 RepID=UPI002F3E55DF